MLRTKLVLLTLDEDAAAAPAAEYLARHRCAWTDYRDTDGELEKELASETLPPTVLINARGRVRS